jgi:hypothetical protein
LHPSHPIRSDISGIGDRPRLGRLVRALLIAVGAAASHPGWAVSVGGPEVQSKIGQPLKVRIPLSLQPAEELSADCLRAINPRGDDGPAVVGPRLAFDSLPRPGAVLLTTRAAVTEPAVRFALQVGCDSPITKEFVVLLELPSADDVRAPALPAVPVAQPEPRSASGAATRTEDAMASVPASRRAGPGAALRDPSPARRGQAARASEGVPAASASAKRPLKSPPGGQASAPAGDQLRLTAATELGLAGGDLKLSSELRMSSVAMLATGAEAARAADPAAAQRLAIEQARLAAFLRDEDPVAAVIAKEKELAARLGQVGGELEKARGELSRAEAAKPAAPATPKPAAVAPELDEDGFLARWWAWLLAGGAVVLGALLIAVATMRRKRQTEQWWTALPEGDSPESVFAGPESVAPRRPAVPAPVPAPQRTVPIAAAAGAPAAKEFFETSTFEMTQAAQREVLAKMAVEVLEHHDLGHDTAAALSQVTQPDTVPLNPQVDEPTRHPDALDFSPPTLPAAYMQRPPAPGAAGSFATAAPTASAQSKPPAVAGYESDAGPGHFPETARGEPLDFDVSLPTAVDFDLSVPTPPAASAPQPEPAKGDGVTGRAKGLQGKG